MIIVKTWLYCKFYNGMKRPYQPCFSVTEIGSVSIWTACMCVCLWALMCLNVCQEREGRKEKEANSLGQAEPRNTPSSPRSLLSLFYPPPFCFESSPGPLLQALPPVSPLFAHRLLSRPRPLSEAPLLLTAHPPQTHRSVCVSCSQSQSRSRSYVCRCPWCRCKWSRSEWWRRRTSRRRPGKDKKLRLRICSWASGSVWVANC